MMSSRAQPLLGEARLRLRQHDRFGAVSNPVGTVGDLTTTGAWPRLARRDLLADPLPRLPQVGADQDHRTLRARMVATPRRLRCSREPGQSHNLRIHEVLIVVRTGVISSLRDVLMWRDGLASLPSGRQRVSPLRRRHPAGADIPSSRIGTASRFLPAPTRTAARSLRHTGGVGPRGVPTEAAGSPSDRRSLTCSLARCGGFSLPRRAAVRPETAAPERLPQFSATAARGSGAGSG